jgi:hypothetical protein
MRDLDEKNQRCEAKSNQVYSSPRLVVYGKVHQLTQGSKSEHTDGSSGKSGDKPSDRSVKQNIVRIGTHPAGLGIYLFDYRPEFREKWGAARQFGVMADEVELLFPSALSTDEYGLRLVNYAALGIVQAS